MSKRRGLRWDQSGKEVYILGLDYQVRDSKHWTEAVTDLLQGKLTPFMVHPTKRIRSAGGIDMAHPIIVRLNYWAPIPPRKDVHWNSKASSLEVRQRDGHTCCYCGDYATTVDHIKPESRCKKDGDAFDGWTWGNLVAACRICNQRKRDRTPEEAGMKLMWAPYAGQNTKYHAVQVAVDDVLATGEGYATEVNRYEGILPVEKNVR